MILYRVFWVLMRQFLERQQGLMTLLSGKVDDVDVYMKENMLGYYYST
jgi:hypothetical protein